MWKLLIFFMMLAAAAPLNGQGAVPPDAQQRRILALENAWNQAQQTKDAAALDMLLAPELSYIEYDGTLMNKAEFLASVRSPTLQPLRIVNESIAVRVYGAVAVANGVVREDGVKNGKPFTIRERYTDTWVRRGDDWVCVASQSTQVPR
jgi:ketosteroid isomerase-like protein